MTGVQSCALTIYYFFYNRDKCLNYYFLKEIILISFTNFIKIKNGYFYEQKFMQPSPKFLGEPFFFFEFEINLVKIKIEFDKKKFSILIHSIKYYY